MKKTSKNCYTFFYKILILLFLLIAIVLGYLKQQADMARDQALHSQSLFLAKLAKQQTKQGNAVNGILLALEALPKLVVTPEKPENEIDAIWSTLKTLFDKLINPERPYVAKAEVALYNALLNQRERLVLQEHTCSKIYYAAFSPNGQYLISAGCDNTARLWDVKTGNQVRLFEGHELDVTYAVFSADGQRILTASKDKTARLWEVNTGQQLAVMTGHYNEVQAIFSADGQRVLSFSDRGYTVYVWDGYTGKYITKLAHFNTLSKVKHAVFSPDSQWIVTVTEEDTRAHLWDVSTGTIVTQLKGHQKEVIYAAFSPDGQQVVTTSDDKTARIWNVNTGEQIFILEGHEASVKYATFNPNGQRILTTSWDNTIRLWDNQTGKQLIVLKSHQTGINHAIFSPNGQYVLTVSDYWNNLKDKTARLWDANTGKLFGLLKGHRKTINFIAFSPNGQQLVTTSNDFTVRLWNTNAGNELLTELKGSDEPINHAAFSTDGQRVLTASGNFNDKAKDFTVRVWDAQKGQLLTVLKGHQTPVVYSDFSPDGQHILTLSRHPLNLSGGKDNSVRLWDANSGDLLFQLIGHDRVIYHATWSPDGKRVATASEDGTARLWDSQTGEQLIVFKNNTTSENTKGFKFTIFSPDGQYLLATNDFIVVVWDSKTGKILFRLPKYDKMLTHAAFSPDGQNLITTYQDNIARIWEAKTGKKRFEVEHDDEVIYAVFSPDSQYFVTTAKDNIVRLWRMTENEEAEPLIAKLKGHKNMAGHVAFSQDGQYMITGGTNFDFIGLQEMTARLWDANPQSIKSLKKMRFWEKLVRPTTTYLLEDRQRAILTGHKAGITSVAFSPDGQHILTASKDGTARLWRIFTTEALIDYAHQVIPRKLTSDQRQQFVLDNE